MPHDELFGPSSGVRQLTPRRPTRREDELLDDPPGIPLDRSPLTTREVMESQMGTFGLEPQFIRAADPTLTVEDLGPSRLEARSFDDPAFTSSLALARQAASGNPEIQRTRLGELAPLEGSFPRSSVGLPLESERRINLGQAFASPSPEADAPQSSGAGDTFGSRLGSFLEGAQTVGQAGLDVLGLPMRVLQSVLFPGAREENQRRIELQEEEQRAQRFDRQVGQVQKLHAAGLPQKQLLEYARSTRDPVIASLVEGLGPTGLARLDLHRDVLPEYLGVADKPPAEQAGAVREFFDGLRQLPPAAQIEEIKIIAPRLDAMYLRKRNSARLDVLEALPADRRTTDQRREMLELRREEAKLQQELALAEADEAKANVDLASAREQLPEVPEVKELERQQRQLAIRKTQREELKETALLEPQIAEAQAKAATAVVGERRARLQEQEESLTSAAKVTEANNRAQLSGYPPPREFLVDNEGTIVTKEFVPGQGFVKQVAKGKRGPGVQVNVGPTLGPGERKERAEAVAALRNLQAVLGSYQGEFVGPIDSRIGSLQSTLNTISQSEANFRSQVGLMRTELRKFYFGTAQSKAELEGAIEALPDLGLSDKQFVAAVRANIKKVRQFLAAQEEVAGAGKPRPSGKQRYEFLTKTLGLRPTIKADKDLVFEILEEEGYTDKDLK